MDVRRETMDNLQRSPANPALKHDAFWHLQAIGLLPVTADPLPPTAERPDSPVWGPLSGAEALVAIIDTGVSEHPYLFERLEPPFNIDLTGEPTLELAAGKPDGVFDGMDADWLEKLGLYTKASPKPFETVLADLVDKYKRKRTFDFGAPSAANQKFAAHGTSCAGLVAASSNHGRRVSSAYRPYYRGVDPDSKVMSITTSFSPHPEMLTLAFLLAARKPADVILFPRGLPREILDKDPNLPLDQRNAWRALKETILAVSRLIPVVCAAGNECDDEAIAPACFAADDNGIIGVAAMNYFGVRSSYSNFGKGVAVAAPSDDAEMFNIDQARLDKTDRFYGEYPYQAFIQNFKVSDVRYGEAAIRAIDVPGPFGFTDTSGNTDDGDVDARLATEPESFFTEFGGTSGAASIVAGVASLMQRAAKLRKGPDGAAGGKTLDGKKLRKLIMGSVRGENVDLLHLAGIPGVAKKLSTDRVNGEKKLEFAQAFGAGLVAADLAVAAASAEPL
jgi:subtilisin family serine protease